jgi:hypothetical protein
MSATTYHPGGFLPTAPAGNEHERWDDATSTYTAWDQSGVQTTTRAYTAAETAAAQAAALSSKDAAAVVNAHQGLDTLHAEVPTWRTQLQADITAVTPGWQTLTAQQQTDIVLRMLNGFGTAMSGLLDHATVTGAIT